MIINRRNFTNTNCALHLIFVSHLVYQSQKRNSDKSKVNACKITFYSRFNCHGGNMRTSFLSRIQTTIWCEGSDKSAWIYSNIILILHRFVAINAVKIQFALIHVFFHILNCFALSRKAPDYRNRNVAQWKCNGKIRRL